jgi:peptidoglycan/LPS O-acetylase OafA/YrhL
MASAQSGQRYRPDVDGLRAIAIVAVVAYHAGVPGFFGGYVGVDVFFVVSGFLITGLLVSEAGTKGGIDFAAFYARRVRRLMPAFLLVLAATLVLGAIFLTPIDGEQQGLAKSGIAALLFNANHYFMASTGGYFDGPTEFQPLVHTWSLSVEEQFYFVWPALILLVLRTRQRAISFHASLAFVFALIWVASLLASAILSTTHPLFAFYAMPVRAFELATGALVALATLGDKGVPRWLGTPVALAGLVAIGLSVVLFDATTRFPGVAALLPVLGTAGLILANHSDPGNRICRALSAPPVVLVGLLSYSWYLWHWPLLAIARASSLGQKDLPRDLALAGAALLLAWLTYRFVENPIRHSRKLLSRTSMRNVQAGLAATTCLVLAFGAFGYSAKRGPFDARTARLIAAAEDVAPNRGACHIDNDRPWDGRFPPADCWVGNDNRRPVLVVWGDSHASQWTGIAQDAVRRGWSVLPRTMSACPPLLMDPGERGEPAGDCVRFNRKVVEEIVALGRTRAVTALLVARWIRPHAMVGEPADEAARSAEPADPGRERYRAALGSASQVLAQLAEHGIQALVVLPTPEMPYPAPLCLAKRSEGACGIPESRYLSDRSTIVEAFARAAKAVPTVGVFDPLAYFCDGAKCPAERNGIVQYFDDNHPTSTAIRHASKGLVQELATIAMPAIDGKEARRNDGR